MNNELAYHLYSALPESDLRKTVQYCRAAARAAAAVFANSDVVRYVLRAIEALDLMENPSVRLRMNLLAFISLYARGHAPMEFLRSIQEVMRLAYDQNNALMLVFAGMIFNVSPGFKPIPGSSPDMTSPPVGCRFHPRCRERMGICNKEKPKMRSYKGKKVRCFLYY